MITPPIDSSPLDNNRLAVALLAGAGAAETGAISYSKLVGNGDGLKALCFAGGSCSDVLNGPWADVFGIPLAAFGALAYASAGALAVAPMLQPSPSGAPAVANTTDKALLGLTAAMATFSACLMLLLTVEIQLPCSLCIGSALLSTAMFAASWRSVAGTRTHGRRLRLRLHGARAFDRPFERRRAQRQPARRPH